ncbi:MAG: hypothetical protein HQK89_13045 [Nitrospirae bacterium]|nr:hypothetical protein [Nitrospirota bacterium]
MVKMKLALALVFIMAFALVYFVAQTVPAVDLPFSPMHSGSYSIDRNVTGASSRYAEVNLPFSPVHSDRYSIDKTVTGGGESMYSRIAEKELPFSPVSSDESITGLYGGCHC